MAPALTLEFLVLTVWAGILATYVHMVLALWAPRYGLPRLDFAAAMADLCFGDAFDGAPPYWLGLIALHLNGVVFALFYATLAGPLLPGPLFIRGLIWGGILFFGSQLMFVPLFLRKGVFGLKDHPRAWMTALVAHGAFGAVLGWLCPVL